LPEAGSAGEKGLGVIRQGFLEMSNVDLANEFTEMIIASRAYQANSRSITTSDEMLQELINLKR
jgi:Flagellar hook protein FlgE